MFIVQAINKHTGELLFIYHTFSEEEARELVESLEGNDELHDYTVEPEDACANRYGSLTIQEIERDRRNWIEATLRHSGYWKSE